jgi:competence CoiA-like predicted nuclease
VKNFKISEEKKNETERKSTLKIYYRKDGSLLTLAFFDIGYGSEKKLWVLKLSPNWIPAMVNNKPVRMEYSLPISIETE